MSRTETSSASARKPRKRAEDAGHADHPLTGEATRLHRDVAHHVERVADDDEDRVRRRSGDLLADRLDDAGIRVEQVIARHARLAGDASRDDDDVGVPGLLVAVGADDARVEPLDRGALPLIQPLALRNPLGDVHHDDGAGEFLFRDALCSRRPDVAGADDGDLVDHESDLFGR
jgi:hypothetical protein